MAIIQDVNQRLLDEDAWWEAHADAWLEDFKKTELYRQLEQEYEPVTFASGIGGIAVLRTRYYRYGPGKLLARQKEKYEYIQLGFELCRAVQEKKAFDVSVKWMAGILHMDGVYFPYQASHIYNQFGKHPAISPIGPADLDFLKSLLADPEYINSREDWGYFEMRADYEIADWLKVRQPDEIFPPDYPVFYRKHDEWFGQAHFLALPQKRREKHEYYMDAWADVKYPEHRNYVSPQGDKKMIGYRTQERFSQEWFDKHEPLEMQRWHSAYMEFCHREKSTDFMSFYNSVKELCSSPVKPYPDGSVGWLDALIRLGMKMRFEKISDSLDVAHAQYLEGLASGINYLEKQHRFSTYEIDAWAENSDLYKHYKEGILGGQSVLGERQTLDYWTI